MSNDINGPNGWMVICVTLVAFWLGILFVFAITDNRLHCNFACDEPEATGYRYEPGKCECIR